MNEWVNEQFDLIILQINAKCSAPITCLWFSKCNLLTAYDVSVESRDHINISLNASYANLYKWYLHVLYALTIYCIFTFCVPSKSVLLLLLWVRSLFPFLLLYRSRCAVHTAEPVDTLLSIFARKRRARFIIIIHSSQCRCKYYIMNSSIAQNANICYM